MINTFRRKFCTPAAAPQPTHTLITLEVPVTRIYYSADSTSEAPVPNIFFTYTTTSLFLMPTTSQLQIISPPQPLFKPHINTKDGLE